MEKERKKKNKGTEFIDGIRSEAQNGQKVCQRN